MYKHIYILNQSEWESLQIVPVYLQCAETRSVGVSYKSGSHFSIAADGQADMALSTCLRKLINGTYTFIPIYVYTK